MHWLRLDPKNIVDRAKTNRAGGRAPSLAESIGRGAIGFTLVSIAGFAPWAVTGRWLHHALGELGLYAVCAAVFILLSGPFLHRLIIGPGSLARFYGLFSIAFGAYAVAWILAWMLLGGHIGSLVGLFLGTLAMGWIVVRAFEASGLLLKVVAVLFVANSLGYFAGGWVEANLAGLKELPLPGMTLQKSQLRTLAQLMWGVCYGLGFGTGLGWAFYQCQAKARARLDGLLSRLL